MIEIIYQSTDKKEYSLIAEKMKLTGGNFHNYTWNPDVSKTVYGDYVYGFSKESVIYDLVLTFRGGLPERVRILNELTNSFEHDIASVTPGRIFVGEYYIECYIVKAKTGASELSPRWTQNEFNVYCPYPFWRKEKKKSFYSNNEMNTEVYGWLDYPYGFPYDFSRPKKGSQHWHVDHHTSSNFEMVIFGPCANPRIKVNENIYQIYETLESREFIVIKSREKKIIKYLANGTRQNIFDKRAKEQSVFEKMPEGSLVISWNGEFGFDLTLYLERSEPEWIL